MTESVFYVKIIAVIHKLTCQNDGHVCVFCYFDFEFIYSCSDLKIHFEDFRSYFLMLFYVWIIYFEQPLQRKSRCEEIRIR